MDTSTLRWILIIVGVVIVASIFLFGNPDKKRTPKASRRDESSPRGHRKKGASMRQEPTLAGLGEGATPSGGAGGPEGEPGGQGELDIDAAESAVLAEPPKPRKPPGPPPDKIVSLFLLARDNHMINGAELLQATVNTGMEFGDMNVFHRVVDGSEQPVFSLANAAKPGHFERDEWNTFETGGLVLFLTLPGPAKALDAWDAMLATARRIGEILHAELLDGERSPFTRQREAQIREEMRDYDRRKSKRG
ncbi:MAG: cell division protein ZipA [Xanthomonadales bacterium]|nr:cell division protein ZipA [Xanthomonadales bacterium]